MFEQLCGRSVWKQPVYNGKSTHSFFYNPNQL